MAAVQGTDQPPVPTILHNSIVDWNKLQGLTNATDEYLQIRRSINSRHITIENSGLRPVGIAITTYCCAGSLPQMMTVLRPGEIKHLGINQPGDDQQYLYLLDPITRQQVGTQTALRTDANSFVLRDGLQGWFVHFFKHPSYRAAH